MTNSLEQQNNKVLQATGQKTKTMKINMTLCGTTVLEGVTASIVVTFIYPGSISHSPHDSICGAGLRWIRGGLLVRIESNINNVLTKLWIREKQ